MNEEHRKRRPAACQEYVFIGDDARQMLVLTYEGARDAAGRDVGFGPGVIEMRYEEPSELEGNYSLYFKVERL